MLTGPVEEGVVAVLGSVLVGVPVGLGLSALSVRVLGLFFTLPPPVLAVSPGEMIAFLVLVVSAATVGFAAALTSAMRARAAAVLREPCLEVLKARDDLLDEGADVGVVGLERRPRDGRGGPECRGREPADHGDLAEQMLG